MKKYFYSGYGVDKDGKQVSWHDGEYEVENFDLAKFKKAFIDSLPKDIYFRTVNIHVISLCLIDDTSNNERKVL